MDINAGNAFVEYASVLELADKVDSKSIIRNDVQVRPLSEAPPTKFAIVGLP